MPALDHLGCGKAPEKDVEPRVPLEGLDLVHGDVPGDVHLAGLEGRDPSRRLDDGAIDHPVHVGLPAPVVFVPLHDGALATDPLDELERTGADRMLPDALVAVLLDGGGADHVVVGKAGDGFDEPHVGLIQLHLEGVLVHYPRALEAPQHAGRGAADLLVVVR